MRFHNELIDFFDYIRPNQKNHEKRRLAFLRVLRELKSVFPTETIIPFGSFVTELYLPSGDIDFVILDEKAPTEELFTKALKLMNEK